MKITIQIAITISTIMLTTVSLAAEPIELRPRGASLRVQLSSVRRQAPQPLAASQDYAGGLLLTLPIGQPPRITKDRPTKSSPKAKTELEQGSFAPSPALSAVLPHIRPRDVLAATGAALFHTRRLRVLQRLRDLSDRARWSGLLPEVRLRAARHIDESSALSPTQYDPDRTTAAGGVSTRLEVRATFGLDRLLFASEEVRLERARRDIEADALDAKNEVVQQLFAWQFAVYRMYQGGIDDAACLKAWIERERLAAMLDLNTDGWFEKWRWSAPLPAGSCLDVAYDDAGSLD